MVNLLGVAADQAAPLDQRLEALSQLPETHLHWYGKTPESPGRKLGHVTVLLRADTAAGRYREAQDALAAIRGIWPLPRQELT